jgi:ABC-2 type transport system ATP-binding protein
MLWRICSSNSPQWYNGHAATVQFQELAWRSLFNNRKCYVITPVVSVIQIENLTRRYGRRRGIERISLSIPEGMLFGFLGPNGAGKTTTIRVMLGLMRPSDGSARLFGLDCWRDSKAIKRDLGYLPGDLRLPPWLTGDKALSIFGAVRGKDIRPCGTELAERLDLDLSVKVREMSRGMRQKLGLILAMAHAPRLLVLDEPTNSLDPLVQGLLHEVLRQLARAGNTIFFSSHSLAEVEQLCERVAIVRDGQLVADDSLAKLRERAGHEVTIRWKDKSVGLNLPPPAFLKLTTHEPSLWQGSLDGPVSNLLDFLTGKQIEDLTIGRPDLETLFRRFYEPAPGGHT